MSGYQHVLCAVDLSDENRLVAARAVDLARQHSAKLTLLHVVEYIPIDLANELVLPQQQEIEEQLVARARDCLTALTAALNIDEVTQTVTTGSTKSEIIEQAKSYNADLIVIGRHGRHGLSRLLGSTANAVLHHAPCDVLAVHIPE
jgi:universal stress protein A